MSADDVVRASVADMPVPDFPNPAVTPPPRLSRARVAVVTTAGLTKMRGAMTPHHFAYLKVMRKR